MIVGRPLYEEFQGTQLTNQDSIEVDREIIEDQKLKSFEDGYEAGWSDAINAQKENQMYLSEHLSESLKSIEFDRQYALDDICQNLVPLLKELILVVLPRLHKSSFDGLIETTARNIVDEIKDSVVQIRVSPSDADALSKFIKEKEISAELLKDSSLLPGQARLESGVNNFEIDCVSVCNELISKLDAMIITKCDGEMNV